MDYRLEDLIDISSLQILLDKLHAIYSFSYAITDKSGKVLTAVAWQDLCAKFHGTNLQCETECIKSEKYLTKHLHEANPAISFQCPHGWFYNTIPIIIGGKHLGNFFTGLFFPEKPDLNFYKKQASEYGFDEKVYLEEVVKVPVCTKEKLCQYLDFIKGFIEFIAGLGLKSLADNEVRKNLKESELKYRSLIESSSDAIFCVDENGQYQFTNQLFASTFNRTPDYFVGKTFWDVYDKEHADYRYEATKRVFQTGRGESIEVEVPLPDKTLYFWATTNPVKDETGKVVLNLTHATNITERKLLEENLRNKESYLKETQAIASLGTYTMDITAGKWISSEILDNIFGIDSDFEKSVEGWISVIHPEWKSKMTDYFVNEVIGNKTKFNKEYVIIRKNDKTERWVHGIGNLKFNENDEPIAMIGTIQDITERKLAEKVLYESERKFREIFEANMDGITILSINQDPRKVSFLDMNGNSAKMLGYTKEEMLKMNPLSLEKHVTKKEIEKRIEDFKLKGSSDFETNFSHKNGSEIVVEIIAKVINYNNMPATMNIVRDITERKQTELALIEAKEKAEESDWLKSAFLANMSHEIRTPMNGILGFTELLKEPNLSIDDQKDFIQTIQISGERMLSTINNIVDVSKIESGLINVVLDEININETIEFLYKFFKPEVEKKGFRFIFNNALPANKAIIKTDNEKVYGILTNLLKNAIKFTKKGLIEFGYVLRSDSEPVHLQFYVKDTGIGIPKIQQQTIFERFRQGSNGLNRLYEGSGLGLSISKSYVEMLGGNIWVESEEGKGSTFCFTIPYNSVVEEKTELKDVDSLEVDKTGMKKLKVLIVEDDEVSYFLLKRNIQKIGKEILHALTGFEAIEVCRTNPDLDLILMDIRMPMMDGNEATRIIRQFNRDVIIIAQTANAFTGDNQKAINAGCNDYISKPINVTLLFELINKYTNRNTDC